VTSWENPQVYDLPKVASETAAGHIAEWSQIPVIGLRFSNILGPPDYEHFPSSGRTRPRAGGTGGAYIDERDAVMASRLALEAPAKGSASYLIAAADTVMDRPSAELLAEVFAGVTLPRGAGEFGTLLAIGPARAALGFTAQHSWRDHLAPRST
jgi:nucleoside-diphosphate-sugar epimerase